MFNYQLNQNTGCKVKFVVEKFKHLMFMFNYQLNQNTGCKVKFVVNMNR